MTKRKPPEQVYRPQFSVPEILEWADAYHARMGKWPQSESGPLADLLGETWRRVDSGLRCGLRGLPGGSSLAQLLAEHRNVRNQGQLPLLRRRQILAWADSHHQRTGQWPISESGAILEAPGETWRAVDQALRVGVRGLGGGSSLAQFLDERRGLRNLQRLPPLTTRRILAWADAHHRRTGEWPLSQSGPIPEAPGETWSAVTAALTIGRRGLPGGSSLIRLLAARRGVRNSKQSPPLTKKQVLAWARAHRRRTGAWPTSESGPIRDAPGETWKGVAAALRDGYRGLPAGLTLAGLRDGTAAGVERSDRPPLTEEQILAWADAHFDRTGKWPESRSGPIADAPGETWRKVDCALRTNRRGLTGGWTLVKLLAERRESRTRLYAPLLEREQVLAWAEAHLKRSGSWPTCRSGPILEAPGETWRGVDEALRHGSRGLRRAGCLARLLAGARGVRNRTNLPRLRQARIREWAEGHHRRTGEWPKVLSGPVLDAPGETWKGIDMALRQGNRGLPGGTSLARLMATRRGVRNRTNLPRLTRAQIQAWAGAHRRRTGRWPTRNSGPITDAPGETWRGVDLALSYGYRGLPGGSSLSRLLQATSGA